MNYPTFNVMASVFIRFKEYDKHTMTKDKIIPFDTCITEGKNKSMLDPFQKENQQDVKRLKELQGDIYTTFTNIVKSRRGDKLKKPYSKLFTGEFWTGRKSLELGLIDGIGELTSVMQERYGERVKFRPVSEPKSWLKQKFTMWLPQGPNVGSWAGELISAAEERALWGRFGL